MNKGKLLKFPSRKKGQPFINPFDNKNKQLQNYRKDIYLNHFNFIAKLIIFSGFLLLLFNIVFK